MLEYNNKIRVRQALMGGLRLTPGSALYMPKGSTFRHKVGPQGLTMVVVVAPPRE